MQRRNFPVRKSDSILLYGFGLALVLSLLFNGFLLYEQRDKPGVYEYESGNSVNPVDILVWQEQLSDCKRANEQKDSLINRLAKLPNAPPDKKIAIQGITSK
ncbi:hypothetical protein [Spirosoma spitsbergense]|jgi:hypothetical protein|uniref:hypothetical protein n=1 Tax=Spirosoma spitsbergense TaxID=431554 RepID=UPI00035FF5AB|nr:hypothetical protein [Spirosoma spitsbergense]